MNDEKQNKKKVEFSGISAWIEAQHWSCERGYSQLSLFPSMRMFNDSQRVKVDSKND